MRRESKAIPEDLDVKLADSRASQHHRQCVTSDAVNRTLKLALRPFKFIRKPRVLCAPLHQKYVIAGSPFGLIRNRVGDVGWYGLTTNSVGYEGSVRLPKTPPELKVWIPAELVVPRIEAWHDLLEQWQIAIQRDSDVELESCGVLPVCLFSKADDTAIASNRPQACVAAGVLSDWRGAAIQLKPQPPETTEKQLSKLCWRELGTHSFEPERQDVVHLRTRTIHSRPIVLSLIPSVASAPRCASRRRSAVHVVELARRKQRSSPIPSA